VSKKAKLCLVSCSVLKEEIEKLVKQGDLDVELAFVSKYFHVEYDLLEKNLRRVVEKTLTRFPGRVILVYGDLCLGQNNEMKKLAEEYGVVKVNALNCIDCQLGGKGKFLDADPNHDLMFLGPGMIGFFHHFKEKMQKENIDEQTFAKLFSGIKGIVLLDTLGEANKIGEEVEKLHSGLTILETREIGLENLKQVIFEAIEANNQKAARTSAK
jgi:hypothetical protein